MAKPDDSVEPELLPPECHATDRLIQRALDGETPLCELEADPHAAVCRACQQRTRAARAFAVVFATPSAPVAVPADFTDRVVNALQHDRRSDVWRKAARTTGKAITCAALAAAVVIAAFVMRPTPPRHGTPDKLPELAKQAGPELAPARHSVPATIRLGDEFAKVEQKFLEVPRPLAESGAAAPKLLAALGSALKLPEAPNHPMPDILAPARRSLAELPVAAQSGLEPVTGTAEKAFKRFLSDMGAVTPRS